MSGLPRLERLAERIGAAVTLEADAMAQAIQAALAEATDPADWLPPERRRANHERYARHLLYSDPGERFSILSIVWDPGQKSPIHGHYCWCSVAVYQGELTERWYRESEPGVPQLVSTTRRRPGTLSFDRGLSGLHRIANESGSTAISLHVYGAGASRINSDVNRVVCQ